MSDMPLVDGDYSVAENGIWVTAGNVSIRIFKTDEMLFVDLYRAGEEYKPPIHSHEMYFSEVKGGVR